LSFVLLSNTSGAEAMANVSTLSGMLTRRLREEVPGYPLGSLPRSTEGVVVLRSAPPNKLISCCRWRLHGRGTGGCAAAGAAPHLPHSAAGSLGFALSAAAHRSGDRSEPGEPYRCRGSGPEDRRSAITHLNRKLHAAFYRTVSQRANDSGFIISHRNQF
jgi:hypothetical protein